MDLERQQQPSQLTPQAFFSKIDQIDNTKDKREALDQRVQDEIKLELLVFLKGQISKVSAKNNVRTRVLEILEERLDDPDQDIPTIVLLRILEVMDKSETDMADSILGVLTKQVTVINNNPPASVPPSGGTLLPNEKGAMEAFSSEEIDKARRMLLLLRKLGQSEFPEAKTG